MMMQKSDKKTENDEGSIVKLEQLRAEIWKLALLASDETSLVQNLLDKAGPVLNCENVSLMPYDEKLKEIVVLQQWRSDGSDIGLGEVIPKWIFKRYIGKPYVQVLFDELPTWLKPVLKIFEKKYGTRSTLIIPYGDARRPEGYISINHYLFPKKYSEKEIELFRELSQIIYLRSKQLKSQAALQQRIREMQSLQATVLEITSPHELSSLLYTIVERAADLLEADTGGMYLCNLEREEVRCVVSYNTPKDYTGVILKFGEGAAGYVAQSGKPLIIDDYRTWSGSASVFNEDKPFERLVSAPMLWQGQVIGVIHVLRSKSDIPFSQSDLELLSYFANHAAIAVANTRQLDSLQVELKERKRAEEKLEIYAHQMTLLNELTRAALEGNDLFKTLQMLTDRLGELLKADGAYITLWDETQHRTIPLMAYGSMREIYSTLHPEPDEGTLTENVLHSGHALAVENTFDTPYLSPRLATLFPERSLLALPMIAGEQKLGAALIAFNQVRQFTQEEIAFGEQTARQVALVVSRLLNLQEMQRLAQEQSLLFKAARDFSAGLDEERILSAIVYHMTTALQVDSCTISRYESGQERIVTLLDFDNAPAYHPEPVGTIHMLADYPVTRNVLESRQPLIVRTDDPDADPAELAVLEQYGYTALMMVPLATRDHVFGLIELSRRPNAPPFSTDDIKFAQTLVSTAAVALENGRLHAEVQALAITDSLTGLTNRRVFDQSLILEIARANRYGHSVTLLFLDIDSFKHYNDTYGHPAGDERLKAIARLLRRNIRQPDLVARYGGEEFVILLPYNKKANALILAERIRFEAEKMYRPSSFPNGLSTDGVQPTVGNIPIPGYTVSIGVAIYPEDARTPEELLQAADAAALAAKRQGKNRICVAPIS